MTPTVMDGPIVSVWYQHPVAMRAYCDAAERGCKTVEDWMVLWGTHRVEFGEDVAVMAIHPFPHRSAA